MEIRLLGDRALVICYDQLSEGPDDSINTFSSAVEPEEMVNSQVLLDYFSLKPDRPFGVEDVVLCFNSIGIYYDPKNISLEQVKDYICSRLGRLSSLSEFACKTVNIPVFYGGVYGPDLKSVGEFLGMTPEEVIAEHCSKTYSVWGIGFLPGFPYMGFLSPKLLLPRKPQPTKKVPAGSVAIAGRQTGI